MKVDQATDGPEKMKQVAAGLDKIKQEVFGPTHVCWNLKEKMCRHAIVNRSIIM